MKKIFVEDIKKKNLKEIRLLGWVHDYRDLKNNKFIILRDSTGSVQCVIKNKDLFEKFKDISLESVIEVYGSLKKAEIKSEFVDIKDKEIEVKDFEILEKAERIPIPIKDKIETELSKRINFRYLDVRKPEVLAIFKIQSCIVNSFREFFLKKNFIEIQPPSIIATATEGGTELFKVKYFERDAYLAQSPQLYKQLMAISLEKVFCVVPVWRAEKHNTIRHLNEIRQMDIEVAFCDDFDVMKILEECVFYIIKKVKKECEEELRKLDKKISVNKAKYLSYKEAIEILRKKGIEISYGEDFTPEAEKKICEIFKDSLVFVHSWPNLLKPFYIMPKDEEISCGFDALMNGIEISSGGQRINKYDLLIKRLKEKNLNLENFEFYVNAFRYGAPKHAGWSIGLERFTMALLKLENIREACLFPRDRERLTP
jgi:aspartyl-tRNA synthetase